MKYEPCGTVFYANIFKANNDCFSLAKIKADVKFHAFTFFLWENYYIFFGKIFNALCQFLGLIHFDYLAEILSAIEFGICTWCSLRIDAK